MSPRVRRLLFYLSLVIGLLAIVIGLFVISPIFGIGLWLFIILGSTATSMYSYFKPTSQNYEYISTASVIPENLQDYHNKILSLGFQSFGETQQRDLGIKMTIWIYRDKDSTITVAMTNHIQPQMRFSTFFEDGFCVSTHFPVGDRIESEKLTTHIVTTSITAAFDYHCQHISQSIPKHGNLSIIHNTEEHLRWERSQRYDRVLISSGFRVWSRIGVALILSIICSTIIIQIIYEITKPSDAELLVDVVSPGIRGFVTLMSVLIFGTWALSPNFWSESVEDRKKRKAKDDA